MHYQPASMWRTASNTRLGQITLALILTLAAMLAMSGLAHAKFPERQVRIIMPFPPGAANDTTMRAIAERLADRWKVPVIVENRAGGSTIIGTAVVANAEPDGYTLLANVALIMQNPLLRKNLSYDPAKLVPVSQVNIQQLVIVARKGLNVHNLDELAEQARKSDRKLNFATFGIGSTAHLMLAKIEQDKNIEMVHVPYKGAGDIVKALMAGEADFAVMDPLYPQPYFKSGDITPVAVTASERLPYLPDTPTMEESGVTGFGSYSWLALFAPTGTPDAVLDEIATAVREVQQEPGLHKRFVEEMRVVPSTATRAEFAKIYKQDTARWADVIKQTGISLE